MEIALHTVLRAGHEADDDAVHAVIPEAVARTLRAAGVRDWRIWRDGRHVFHLVDVCRAAGCALGRCTSVSMRI